MKNQYWLFITNIDSPPGFCRKVSGQIGLWALISEIPTST